MKEEKRRVYPQTHTLYPFQRHDIRHVVKRKRSLIAWEPGLGKTIASLVSLNYWQTQYVVVICPAVMRATWEKEYIEWSQPFSNIPPTVYYSSKQPLVPHTQPQVIIISYHLAATPHFADHIQNILKQHNSLLICDEFHNLRHWSAKRTKVVAKQFSPCTTYLLGLTGTPMLNCVTDLHSQFSIIEPGKWGKFKQFGATYSHPVPSKWHRGVEYRGTRNLKQLQEKYAPFLFKRTQEKELSSLPALNLNEIRVLVPEALAKETLQFTKIITNKEGQEVEIPNAVSTLRLKLGRAKLKAALEWLDDWLEAYPDKPIVIFAYHKEILADVQQYLNSKDITNNIIQGGTTNVGQIVQDYQSGTTQALVVQIIAGGVGLTLTKGNTALVIEPDWVPANNWQAIKRLHRISQKLPVNIYTLIASNSLDIHILKLIRNKMKEINATLIDSE